MAPTKPYTPVEELDMLCRYCKKPISAVLERGVPDSGRIIDDTATFEYVCTKCNRTHYYHGYDLLEAVTVDGNEDAETEAVETDEETVTEAKPYSISEKFRIGEYIKHPSYDVDGLIVGKIPGEPGQIIVQFLKKIKYFIENTEAK